MLIVQKFKDYQQLMKLNLSMLVVFSSVVGYIIIPDLVIHYSKLLYLFLGGTLITAAANAGNEILERDIDKIMRRTRLRPLPDGRMSILEASVFCCLTLIAGLAILWLQFNMLTAILSFFSFALYVGLYTPLKKVTPFSVLVGAFPGSLPCLIGWVAGTNEMTSMGAWTLFIIQFFWQFPHFWSIAWIGHEDYEKAGLKMLPRIEKVGHFTAFQCVIYSAVLIPLSALPMITIPGNGWISVIGLGLASIWFLYNSLQFLKDNSDLKARRVMFASFVYLPVTLLSLVLDKYL
ncbi:MAG: protoheme IX farnesyltransferase [Bacteroidetes bacterium]|nr:protoheme IX farnesyltransferase [Bacteroidota bacterium]